MSSPIDETLVERVGRLERDLGEVIGQLKDAKRRTRRTLYAFAMLLFLVVTSAILRRANTQPDQHQDVVRAQSFILQDDHGYERAKLGVFGNTPVLAFYDRYHGSVIEIRADPTGVKGLVINDPTTVTRLALGKDAEGDVGLTVYNPSGRARLTLSSDKEDNGFLKIYDSLKHLDGAARVVIGEFTQGDAGMAVFDDIGRQRLSLGDDKDEVASLKIHDAKGNLIGTLPAGGERPN